MLLYNETEIINLGRQLARYSPLACCFYLYGDLGVGKTTLARAFIQALIPQTKVKSPTYTIIESYKPDKTESREIHHLDLYRINNTEELEYCALRDYVTDEAVFLIEWPEKGEGVLPLPDICIKITMNPSDVNLRYVDLTAATPKGVLILEQLQ